MASKRLRALIEGLKSTLGEEETMILLGNSVQAEEIADAAKRHSLAEIDAALAAAREAGAARWAWIAKRLRGGDDGQA